jgi:hypothetical protein
VPALVLAEVDCFLRNERQAMRKLVAEVFSLDEGEGRGGGPSATLLCSSMRSEPAHT